MNVVLAVAPDTHRGGLLNKECFEMALVTCHLTVFSFQVIPRFLGMVERMPFPVLCRVTKLTLLPEFPLVIIVLLVTAITDRWRILKKWGLVAFSATDLSMFSKEGKPRLLMIELMDILPTHHGMTLLTRFPQSSFMFVILSMAAQALAGDLPSLLKMTLSAFHLKVLSHQWIRSGRMIKPDPFPVLG